MSQKVSIDYKCRRCGKIIHETIKKMSAAEVRERIEDGMIDPGELHECSKRVYGVTELVGYSLPLED